jgi:hypothetical protein
MQYAPLVIGEFRSSPAAVKLERKFDRRLQNARAADTVEVADAAAWRVSGELSRPLPTASHWTNC